MGVGVGVGDGVGLGFAASAVRSNPDNTSVVANNDVTGLVIGFIPMNSHRVALLIRTRKYKNVTQLLLWLTP